MLVGSFFAGHRGTDRKEKRLSVCRALLACALSGHFFSASAAVEDFDSVDKIRNNSQFYESFDSIEAIRARVQAAGGSEANVVIEPGLFSNSAYFEKDALLAHKISGFNAAEGTMMFWISPRYPYLDPASHTFLSFRQAPHFSACNNANYTTWDFAFSDGWWESSGGAKYPYFINNPLHVQSGSPDYLFGNKWRFVALTWKYPPTLPGEPDKRSMRIYNNGEIGSTAVDSFTTVCPYAEPSSPPVDDLIYIGNRRPGTAFGGVAQSNIDEFLIYPRALTPEEIDQAYKTYLGQEWEHHRHIERMEPEINNPYKPKRDRFGRIVENRAIFDEGATYVGKVDEIVALLKRLNVNTFITNIWHGFGTRYYSTVEPRFEEGPSQFKQWHTNGEDELAHLIKKAHAAGIEVHPWFTISLNMWGNNFPYPADWKSSDGSFNVHHPDFQKYIVKMMVDVVRRYDVDGINLDYIRTTSACSAIDEVCKAQAEQSVRKIVEDFSSEARVIKPNLAISVDANLPEEVGIGPSRVLSHVGRNSGQWLESGIIDFAFDMDYEENLSIMSYETARSFIPLQKKRTTKLLGNYDFNQAGVVVPRKADLVARQVNYSQRKWPGTVGIYFLSPLYVPHSKDPVATEAQINALITGPFASPALPHWSFDKPLVRIESQPVSSVVRSRTRLNFLATAFDHDDGDLTDKIEWKAVKSNGSQKVLGIGSRVAFQLGSGKWEVVATVKDSQGYENKKSIPIIVLPRSR